MIRSNVKTLEKVLNDYWTNNGARTGNEFALDFIDAAVKRANPEITQQELNKTTDKLYQDLHRLLAEAD